MVKTAWLALFTGGFIALMAWTGALSWLENSKGEALHWLVDQVVVEALGRLGAVLVFLAGGLVAAVVAWRWAGNTER